jgi:DNA repair protein RecN (Recombination protein N)
MLSQLKVTNFAIADHIEVLFEQGMTVLSGETGAGKSIILDALGLALGDRADTSMVRHGEKKAEISASFELEKHPKAVKWLQDHDLDDELQCIIRRVITAEGRSRSYINGHPCPLQNLKSIGELLIDIHSQHEHQSLLQKEKHRIILDDFGKLQTQSKKVISLYNDWTHVAQKLTQLESNQDESNARIQLLTFQVDEFDKLSLQENEIKNLEQEQSSLANAELLLGKAHEALSLCSDSDTNATTIISSATLALQNLPSSNQALTEAFTMLSEAQIQIEEASNNLRHFTESFELDPERLQYIEERLSAIYQLARKHRCQPEELLSVYHKLTTEMAAFNNGDQNLEQLEKDVQQTKQQFIEAAKKQRHVRIKHASKLEKSICEQLALMDMKSVKFSIEIKPLENINFNQHGLDSIEFLVSTNPGQPPKAISKVASGGELSRISLAIQVIIAKNSTIPTLVFDEVDVGIGGGTAQIVGRLLKSLGKNGQIICVTHLPQVASQGDNHFFISKRTEKGQVKSSIDLLAPKQRTDEIARMLGGVTITTQTLAHAQEMLETV